MRHTTIAGQHRHFVDLFIGHRRSSDTELVPGSLGRVRPVRTRESVLFSDDEEMGRFAGLLRQ